MRIDERNLEIRLDPSQEVDWQGDKLSSYLSNINIKPQGEGVFLATLGSAEIRKNTRAGHQYTQQPNRPVRSQGAFHPKKRR